MSVYDLARPEIRDLVPYATPPVPDGYTRMNANEASGFPYALASAAGMNRYPEMRPQSIQSALAGLYGVREGNLCPTRGSSEGIDLLIRTFCRAYRSNVVVLPPTFEMYSAYAAMQGAEIRYAPLVAESDFTVDWQAVERQCDGDTRIVFLCSPNNPTGNLLSGEEILRFTEQRHGRSLVVVDEAYIEFSGQPSLASEVDRLDNLVVLRTLSKAYALAGVRCGAVVGSAELIRMISALLSPYAISAPVTKIVLGALQEDNAAAARRQIDDVIGERERLSARLRQLALTDKVWTSAANFVLTRFADLDLVHDTLAGVQILIREFADDSGLHNCARITVGTPAESNRLLDALAAAGSRLA